MNAILLCRACVGVVGDGNDEAKQAGEDLVASNASGVDGPAQMYSKSSETTRNLVCLSSRNHAVNGQHVEEVAAPHCNYERRDEAVIADTP